MGTAFALLSKEEVKKKGRKFNPKKQKNKLGQNITIRQIKQQQVNQELKSYHKTAIVKTTGVSERPKVARSHKSCQCISLQIETEISLSTIAQLLVPKQARKEPFVQTYTCM